MEFDKDPEKLTPEQRMRMGEMCQRALNMMEADRRLAMGTALARAAAQMDLTLSTQLQDAALRTVTKVMTGGGIENVARKLGILPGQN